MDLGVEGQTAGYYKGVKAILDRDPPGMDIVHRSENEICNKQDTEQQAERSMLVVETLFHFNRGTIVEITSIMAEAGIV